MTNTFMHSLENRTRIQTKIGKVYTRFQTKTAQKAIPFRAAHTYKANVREHAFSQDRRRVKGGAKVHPALWNIEVFDQCKAKTAFDSMKFSSHPPNPLWKHTTVTWEIMDHVIKTRAELTRGLKQGLIIRLPKFWKQAAQQQQQFHRNSPFYLHERLK